MYIAKRLDLPLSSKNNPGALEKNDAVDFPVVFVIVIGMAMRPGDIGQP